MKPIIVCVLNLWLRALLSSSSINRFNSGTSRRYSFPLTSSFARQRASNVAPPVNYFWLLHVRAIMVQLTAFVGQRVIARPMASRKVVSADRMSIWPCIVDKDAYNILISCVGDCQRSASCVRTPSIALSYGMYRSFLNLRRWQHNSFRDRVAQQSR